MRWGTHNLFNIPKFKIDLKEIYLSILIRQFALSLISIFIPIYLVNLGYTWSKAFLFLLILYFFVAVFSPLPLMLAHKYGIKHTTVAGPLLSAIYLGLLRYLEPFNNLFFIIPIIGALGLMLYWVPMNSYFSLCCDKKHRSEESSYLFALPSAVGVIAPLVGGYLIVNYNFGIALAAAFLLMLFSVKPLFWTGDFKEKLKFSLNEVFKRDHGTFFTIFIVQGILFVIFPIAWPVYSYLVFGNIIKTGAIAATLGLSIGIFSILIGKLADKVNKILMIRLSGALGFFTWMLAGFLPKNEFIYYVFTFLIGSVIVLSRVPLFSFFIDKHKGGEFMTMREIGLGSGRVLALAILVLVPLYAKFTYSFFAAAFASLFFIFCKFR